MDKIVFGIIGGGWRAEFYLRIAKELPEQFEVSRIFVRDEKKARAMERQWNVRTVSHLDEFVNQMDYAFVVLSVIWEANPELIIQLSNLDIPILAETPPAPDVDGLIRLYKSVPRNAKIEIAEQYLFQPMHAARIALSRSGKLGDISQVQISAAHGYHGISLIRNYLGIGYEDARITGQKFVSPIIQGPDRQGIPRYEERKDSIQQLLTLQFADKLAVFDFTGDQYFSWIRKNRVLVRGDRGEIMNQEVSYLEDYKTPVFHELRRVDTGHNGNLEGYYHRGIQLGGEWLYQNQFIPGRLSDDEIAIATCLYKMGLYVADKGNSFYSLAEASQDQYLSILMKEAVETGQIVNSVGQPWSSG
ncbi:Gfo/Idh/MocA family protein [Paenibacillus crassostreae]|uniref:Oxidoreductase n=1 Tax=Paenibacillus crassostreae TaxID=1763538 RepID=A0A167G2X6_9BACL|nr:Gfo/Idh/MocA family oxidoreductase [Paenibacillus crassostreae]AOZ93813.1 oxidoreductase [Paenibacillus crassostreae]OAB77154.1 oxidoreductase [Paenibacillus crassostreae]